MTAPTDRSRPGGGGSEVDETIATIRQPSEDLRPDALPPGYVQGLDGKRYRRRPLAPQDRQRLAGRVHYLRHDDGLTVRGIVAALADDGWTTSVGTVHALLTRWRCPECSGCQNRQPEQTSADTCSDGAIASPEQPSVAS